MAKEQKGFITYGDFEAVADELTDEQLGQIMRAKLKYFNSGKAPKFEGILKYVWIPIQQQMDRDSESYEKKCAKMRENANKRWAKTNNSESMQLHPNDANTKTNTDTKTDTDTDTNTDTTSSGTDAGLLSFDLIQYLNEKTGSDYKADRPNAKRIKALLDSGYTPEQMRSVIDKKCAEWMGDGKMRSYLRPSTLFGDKFGEYLAAPVSVEAEKKQKADADRASLERTLSEKQQALSDLKESLAGADKTERRHLREQIAILEDSIKIIEGRLKCWPA